MLLFCLYWTIFIAVTKLTPWKRCRRSTPITRIILLCTFLVVSSFVREWKKTWCILPTPRTMDSFALCWIWIGCCSLFTGVARFFAIVSYLWIIASKFRYRERNTLLPLINTRCRSDGWWKIVFTLISRNFIFNGAIWRTFTVLICMICYSISSANVL